MVEEPLLHAIIASRSGCYKCGQIQEILTSEGVPSKVLNHHEGGAKFLAEKGHLPRVLPCTFLMKGDQVLFIADGLSDFLEKWEEFNVR